MNRATYQDPLKFASFDNQIDKNFGGKLEKNTDLRSNTNFIVAINFH
jgi:hypothetical protein